MLDMAQIHYIKHLRDKEGLSLNAISKKLGINWRTTKKYADGEVPIRSVPISKRGMMYEGIHGDIVDVWLEEDALIEPKYRRTNKLILEELKKNYGFEGSYRTVCAYIQERKPALKVAQNERYERLEHPPGEAQLDFGKMRAVQEGEYVNLSALILSFPYSNAGFAYPLPAENSECLMTGLGILFKQAGGVPSIIRIDNMSTAVVSVGKGANRTYTDEFLACQAHYRFEVQACNPASGHEKGNVEKKVGYTRKNLFVPEPEMESLSQLADWMEQEMKDDRERPHYEKDETISALWEQERPHLKPLPENERPSYCTTSAVVNKYGEVRIDEKWMLVPGSRPKQTLILQKQWNTVTFFSSVGEQLYEAPRPYMTKRVTIPWDDVLTHWGQKTRAVSYSRYFPYLPKSVQAYLIDDPALTRQHVHRLLLLVKEGYGLSAIGTLFESPFRIDSTTDELLACLQAKAMVVPDPFEEHHTPALLAGVETDLQTYNTLLNQGGAFYES